ncbi:hypothetical protein FSP39_012174 [Pinctada imbricata]|uniref:Uncharacterized protein n=1 Tax=Pinctada imbricata TaxID=66713 RepID=A0AA88YTW5_PINIB|nr:hypothetical protein FSP39_012174 [Pinctada imbricata]
MGSIEVYDTKLAKWVPYVPDYKKWEQHFKDISEGRVIPDHKRRYIVGSGSRNKVSTKQPEQPKLTLVTPVAQAVEMAKSELKREGRERKHKATSSGGPSSKKLKF